MENNKKKQRRVILLLIIAVLAMTVGFAVFNSTLNINGTVKVKPTKWSVHFVADDYTETASSEAASAHSVGTTDYSFTVQLDEPGDFYEATVNVINDGNFAANLKTLTMSTLTTEQAKYLTYSVFYNGTEYTQTTNNLAIPLAVGATVPVKVRVTYVLPENAEDLPVAAQGETTVNVSVTGSLYYEKAN